MENLTINENLKLQQEDFENAHGYEYRRPIFHGQIYYLVEELEGVDHFGEQIWEKKFQNREHSRVSDYATLFLSGKIVRISELKRIALNGSQIMKVKIIHVPEWQ